MARQELLGEFQTGKSRHGQIREDQVEGMFCERHQSQGRMATAAYFHGVSEFLQQRERLAADAETAWSTLRRASHESNVKLRTLAVALMEHIGGSPAEQPAAASPIVPDEAARKAARLLWAVLTHAPKPVSAGN